MSTLIELRPDRRLLDHSFEGYKLSLAALAHWSRPLDATPDTHVPDEPQYSFLHAKLFALHQHLRPDPHQDNLIVYYIDSGHAVRAITFNSESHHLDEIIVYDIPKLCDQKPGNFNPCLFFPTSDISVVSDGKGYIHIALAENRNDTNRQWRTLHSQLILGEGKYFVIIDCRFSPKEDHVHCLLESIEQNDDHFSTVLTWVTFLREPDTWRVVSTKVIKGKGAVHYAALEAGFSAAYVISDNPFKYTFDSEKEIIDAPKIEPRQIIYTWLQTADDVTVTLKLPADYNRDLVRIDIGPMDIKVSYAGGTFIDGKFRHRVESDLTTWNIQDNGQLDILVTKSDSALWDELVVDGDSSGEQILDAALVEEAHRRLAHLCSDTEVTLKDNGTPAVTTEELEECDVPSEEDTVLVRLDSTNHAATHRIPLSVNQYLFSINLDPQEAPALAVRHDVDACVWQPYSQLVNSGIWPVKHQGTLMAFGYVQSSKQNKKFVSCSPNFAYSVVSEASRHVFIYRACGAASQDCQLRKRGTGGGTRRVSVGQQYVFNIDQYGGVLGLYASNQYLFILTESTILVIEMI